MTDKNKTEKKGEDNSPSAVDGYDGLLTMTEMFIMIDTLAGSLKIADGAGIFTYGKEVRQELWKNIHDRLNSLKIKPS